MTPQERHAYLIKLGTEAVSIAMLDHASSPDFDNPEALSRRIRAHMSERMAQAAQVWGGEVDEGDELAARVRRLANQPVSHLASFGDGELGFWARQIVDGAGR